MAKKTSTTEDAVEVEHLVKVLPIDDNYLTEIDNLRKDGWELMQGVPAVAVYHLIRAKNRDVGPTGKGDMLIDESKVFVIPAGSTKN